MNKPNCKLCGKNTYLVSNDRDSSAGGYPYALYHCQICDYEVYITADGHYYGKIALEWIHHSKASSIRFAPKDSVYQISDGFRNIIGSTLLFSNPKTNYIHLGVFDEMTPELARKWLNKLKKYAVF